MPRRLRLLRREREYHRSCNSPEAAGPRSGGLPVRSRVGATGLEPATSGVTGRRSSRVRLLRASRSPSPCGWSILHRHSSDPTSRGGTPARRRTSARKRYAPGMNRTCARGLGTSVRKSHLQGKVPLSPGCAPGNAPVRETRTPERPIICAVAKSSGRRLGHELARNVATCDYASRPVR